MPTGNRVVSGLYKKTAYGRTLEVRLDVDGTYPQMKLSLTLTNTSPGTWIADMASAGNNRWEGDVWYRKSQVGATNDEMDTVVSLNSGPFDKLLAQYGTNTSGAYLDVHFINQGHDYGYWRLPKISDYFRETQLELDYEQGVNRWLTYDTSSLDRPAGVAAEELTLEKIYGRAGIEITRSSAVNAVPGAGAGANEQWNSQELHDAMIANWSRSEGDPWAMWVFFAKEYENRPGFVTFGIMFDTIGAHERSGTAIFSQAIADFYPAGTANRNAIIQRHHFRTMIHEIGHAFNLLHSWQKELPGYPGWHNSVVNEPNAGSFMNYPRRVAGGADAYWRDFAFRFSDQELLFLRHAPESYVSMGTSAFGTDHATTSPSIGLMQELSQQDDKPATLQLDLRVNKERPVFEFMEPVNIELKLKNISNQTREVDQAILKDIGHMTISITRDRTDTKQYRSYSQVCYAAQKITLQPGESLYDNLFLSAGSLGWYIADPGMYEITVALSAAREDDQDKEIVSASFSLIVLRPNMKRKREEEKLAQDVFNDDVGRILAFQGSRILESGNNVLQELSERFPQANAVPHAQVALEVPKLRNFKTMEFHNGKPQVTVQDAKLEEASQQLHKVLVDNGTETVNILGNIGFKQVCDTLSQELAEKGAEETAAAVGENVLKVMDKRRVKLPTKVKQEIESKVESWKNGKGHHKGKKN